MANQETIIYRLVVRNPSYDAYFSFLNFRATLGGKMGVVTTRTPNGLGSPNPAKKFSHCTGWTFWANHSLFLNFQGWTLLSLKTNPVCLQMLSLSPCDFSLPGTILELNVIPGQFSNNRAVSSRYTRSQSILTRTFKILPGCSSLRPSSQILEHNKPSSKLHKSRPQWMYQIETTKNNTRNTTLCILFSNNHWIRFLSCSEVYYTGLTNSWWLVTLWLYHDNYTLLPWQLHIMNSDPVIIPYKVINLSQVYK